MKSIWCALLLFVPVVSGATNISVGGVSLEVPNPSGFSPVTRQMALLYEMQKQFVAPTNEEFVVFIPEQYVPAVLEDDIPDMPRRFAVQTAKSLVGASVSTAEFEKLKSLVKSPNDVLMRKVEAQLPGMTKKMNESVTEKYDVDLAFSVSQMVPMPAHVETDRTLAYSALVKYDMKDENGNPAPFVAVVTATFAHVKGKVLFLYSYAEESGLEWRKHHNNGLTRSWPRTRLTFKPL